MIGEGLWARETRMIVITAFGLTLKSTGFCFKFLMGARSPRNQYSSVSPYTLLLLILIGTILPEHMMVRT